MKKAILAGLCALAIGTGVSTGASGTVFTFNDGVIFNRGGNAGFGFDWSLIHNGTGGGGTTFQDIADNDPFRYQVDLGDDDAWSEGDTIKTGGTTGIGAQTVTLQRSGFATRNLILSELSLTAVLPSGCVVTSAPVGLLSGLDNQIGDDTDGSGVRGMLVEGKVDFVIETPDGNITGAFGFRATDHGGSADVFNFSYYDESVDPRVSSTFLWGSTGEPLGFLDTLPEGVDRESLTGNASDAGNGFDGLGIDLAFGGAETVPEPGSLLLIGSGLLGLGLVGRRQRRRT